MTMGKFKDLKEGLNQNRDAVNRSIKAIREEFDKQAEENNKLMVNLVSRSDFEKIYSRFSEYASFEDFEKFRLKVDPMVSRCENDLMKYEKNNTQMREMIRRFDELISDKVNKYTFKKLEEYVDETFLEKSEVEQLKLEFTDIKEKNKIMVQDV